VDAGRDRAKILLVGRGVLEFAAQPRGAVPDKYGYAGYKAPVLKDGAYRGTHYAASLSGRGGLRTNGSTRRPWSISPRP